jgi:hypothetical protein
MGRIPPDRLRFWVALGVNTPLCDLLMLPQGMRSLSFSSARARQAGDPGSGSLLFVFRKCFDLARHGIVGGSGPAGRRPRQFAVEPGFKRAYPVRLPTRSRLRLGLPERRLAGEIRPPGKLPPLRKSELLAGWNLRERNARIRLARHMGACRGKFEVFGPSHDFGAMRI